MKKIPSLLALVSILAFGCTGFFPKTTEEFKGSPAFLRHIDEEYMVNRGFASVLKSIQDRGVDCYTGWKGGWEDELISTYREDSIRYTAKLVINSNDSATFSIQKFKVDATYIGGVDENGMFIYLADIKADGESTTAIETYRALFFYDDIAETVKAWANGKDVKCPMELH